MIKLLPTPKRLNIINEEKMQIKACIHALNPSWEKYARVFADYFKLAYNIDIHYEKGGIELIFDQDLKSAEYIIERRGLVDIRVGQGYDVHRLVEGRRL